MKERVISAEAVVPSLMPLIMSASVREGRRRYMMELFELDVGLPWMMMVD